MRRGLLLFVTWLTGTAVATTLAWGAVSVVRHNVTDRRVAPLSARAVSEALDTTPDTQPPETTTTLAPVDVAPTPTTLGAPVVPTLNGGRPVVTTTTRPRSKSSSGGTPAGGGTASGGSTGGQQPSTGATTPPSGGTSSGGTGGGGTSSPTTTSSGTTRRFVITNGGETIGWADIVCKGTTASHGSVSATKQGWSFRVDKNGPDEVIIRFQSSDGKRETKIRGAKDVNNVPASCDASGQPKATFEESP